jgi:ketosteroid isomerase-like protein
VIDESPAPVPQPVPREPPATQVVRPVPAPAVTPARNDRADVETIVRRYQDAYARLDAAGVQALWPSMPAAAANQLRQNFAGAREYDLELSGGNISISGETATANYSGRVAFTPKVGRASAVNVDVTFRLRKAGDAWTIESVDTRRR